ncbi:MAG: hypothetical protein K0Q57_437 [Gammaproteobacteria bacterium]|jgi:hypothetical protein|nr:hypothetical protein [Gammaproteobacteria bacterium]
MNITPSIQINLRSKNVLLANLALSIDIEVFNTITPITLDIKNSVGGEHGN